MTRLTEISDTLQQADTYLESLKTVHRDIYAKRYQLDRWRLDLDELDALAQHVNQEYKEIQHTCTQCGSFLTREQSMRRMQLDNNSISVRAYRNKLNCKIKELQAELDQAISQATQLEQAHSHLLK